ncbi:hypothetical protein [Streptomyces sp. NPDC088727]|uniref:hypothetical protein n=1 Tax=Streptomyces sp. NPDC088727 TaxID=3365875 RepID=UPI0037F6C882
MDFDLAPPTGVGPLRIGMTRHAAGMALDSLRDPSAVAARNVVRRVGGFTSIEEDPDDAASFTAQDLLLSFWRPFAADDEPEEEQGYYFSSVLVAQPGYYDAPCMP